jgi:hypothetical protein
MKNQDSRKSETREGNNPNRNKGNKSRRFSAPRPPRIFWKSLLTNKAFDLLIVVLGITIAYQLNSWRTATKENRLQQFYVDNLKKDVSKDIEELDKGLKELQYDYQRVISYLEEYGRQTSVGDSLGSIISSVLTLDTFERNENTYSSMLSGNTMSVVNDPVLRNQIVEYYNHYNSIHRFEEKYATAIVNFDSYFSPYCDYTFGKIVGKSVLSNVETKNNLLLAASHLEDGIESYEEAMDKAKKLKAIL